MTESLPRIFGWAADMSGCGYYRVGLPLHILSQAGKAQAAAGVMLNPPWAGFDEVPDVEEAFEHIDVLVGQRVCNEGASKTWQMACRVPHLTTVFEIDDDLFQIDPANRAAHNFYGDPTVIGRLYNNIESASVVTCSTEPLARLLRGINPNVVVVPNRIDAGMLQLPSRDGSEFAVGWAGSGSHYGDFEIAGGGVANFLNRNPKVRFHTIGVDLMSQRVVRPEQVKATGWVHDIWDYYRTLTFSVGIAPLAHTRFNNSKSHIKALEYMALGIVPIVADELPYRDLVVHGVNGYIAKTATDWERYLRTLSTNPKLRSKMANAGRETAALYTIQNDHDDWLTVLTANCQVE